MFQSRLSGSSCWTRGLDRLRGSAVASVRATKGPPPARWLPAAALPAALAALTLAACSPAKTVPSPKQSPTSPANPSRSDEGDEHQVHPEAVQIVPRSKTAADSAAPTCLPLTEGFWMRQCAGPHPSGEHDRLPSYVGCVSALATFRDVSSVPELCDRLRPQPPSEKCEQAEAQLMTLALNTCSARLDRSCCLGGEGSQEPTTAADAVAAADVLLSNATRTFEQCGTAQDSAARINEGRASCTSQGQACESHNDCPDTLLCLTVSKGRLCNVCPADTPPCTCGNPIERHTRPTSQSCVTDADCQDLEWCGPLNSDSPVCPPCVHGWCAYASRVMCLCERC
jgi:hypothetical protein